MAIKQYRLAKAEALIPMPDRGGRLFTADPGGEAVDTESPFYRTLIADGDIVPVERKTQSSTKGK